MAGGRWDGERWISYVFDTEETFHLKISGIVNSDECEKHPVVKAVNNLMKGIKHPPHATFTYLQVDE